MTTCNEKRHQKYNSDTWPPAYNYLCAKFGNMKVLNLTKLGSWEADSIIANIVKVLYCYKNINFVLYHENC